MGEKSVSLLNEGKWYDPVKGAYPLTLVVGHGFLFFRTVEASAMPAALQVHSGLGIADGFATVQKTESTMAVLVTGGGGYIGSATVEVLLRRGEEVVVLDDLKYGHRAAVPEGVPLYVGSVGDRALVQQIAGAHDLEACLHFAALTHVGESVQEPGRYYQNNVAQGLALLDALRGEGVEMLVFSSTCATYGEPQYLPMDEAHPQRPENPYGWSKYFLERILQDCDRAYGLRFVALRYFNAAGASLNCGEDHDPENHLIPNVLRAALGQLGHLSVFGRDYPTPDGTPVRDYIHVADLGRAHALALNYLRGGGASDFF